MAELKTNRELSEEERMKQMAAQMREIQVFLPEGIEALRTAGTSASETASAAEIISASENVKSDGSQTRAMSGCTFWL